MDKMNTQYVGAIVQKALENGALKLIGPSPDSTVSKKNAESDATYLLTLMTKLTEGQPSR